MDIIWYIVALWMFLSAVGVFIYTGKEYKKTSYYEITKTSRWFMDKGTLGEYLTYKSLKHFENIGGKFLFNVYVPKADGEMTEIDSLLITPKGVFVFESKNYGGWIFGDEAYKNWTQTFPLGRGRSHKGSFYNPIRQNANHIKHLKHYIGKDFPVWSIIAFSDECTLRKITIRSHNVRVANRCDVASEIFRICADIYKNVLSEEEIKDIYYKLYPCTQVGHAVKLQHIEHIKNRL